MRSQLSPKPHELIDINSQICTSTGIYSEPSLGIIDHRLTAVIPVVNPVDPTHTTWPETVKKGDVIEYSITSSRSGEVAVHGLMDPKIVSVGEVTRVKFRAIYSGRFPLHFHGANGSHFAVAEIHVMP